MAQILLGSIVTMESHYQRKIVPAERPVDPKDLPN